MHSRFPAISRLLLLCRYQLAGSYAEPIAGDEDPETCVMIHSICAFAIHCRNRYGVPITSLHTDHVAANNMRIINWKCVRMNQRIVYVTHCTGTACSSFFPANASPDLHFISQGAPTTMAQHHVRWTLTFATT